MSFINSIKNIFYKKNVSAQLKNAHSSTKPADVVKFTGNNALSSFDFGLVFFFLSLFFFFLGKHSTSSLVLAARENFSTFILFEFLLFTIILFLFLTFFGITKKFQHNNEARFIISRIYTSNAVSLFFAYAFLLFLNFCAYTWPGYFYIFFRTFWTAGINLHAHEYVLLSAKIIYLALACTSIIALSNYLSVGKISFQYFNLVILMIWAGLFAMSLLNILYILLIFDAIGLMTVAIVGLSAAPKFEIYLTYALHYFMLSAITSLFAYSGCLILHNIFNTFNVNAIIFTLREGGLTELTELNGFILGCAFIFVKIFFLLGLFPFYQYVLEVSSAVNYGFLFYFLVVSKFPVLIFMFYLIKIVWLNILIFKQFILVVSLSSIIFSTLFVATTPKIKHFFALSSINQMGFVVSLFAFNDIFGASVGILYFLVYAISVAPLLIFMTFVTTSGATKLTDGDLDTWPDLARCAHDTYLLIKNRRDSNIHSASPINNFDNFNLFALLGFIASSFGLITLAGFPPTAGFFLKMSFVEVFIAHNYYLTASVVVFSSLVTAYAYTNVLIFMQPEFRWVDSNSNLYDLKTFYVNKAGGWLFFIFSTLIVVIVVFSANSFFFNIFVNFSNLFFYDNAYHYVSVDFLHFHDLYYLNESAKSAHNF